MSCLMVTADRPHLVPRALACYSQQTWRERELIVVDNGIAPIAPPEGARYHREPPAPDKKLGYFRNVALELARGPVVILWDDDDYHHPERIARQLAALEGHEASLLRKIVNHLDLPEYTRHPYRVDSLDGVSGTLMFRKSELRFPNLQRREDWEFYKRLRPRARLLPESHLYLRSYHGANTWDPAHFLNKLRRGWRGKLHAFVAQRLRGDLRKHPWFRLTPEERDTWERYLALSRSLGLLADA